MTDSIGPMRIDSTEIITQVVGNKALSSAAADQSSIEVDSTNGYLKIKSTGTSLSNGVQRGQMSAKAGLRLTQNLGIGAGGGGLYAFENTYGKDLMVRLEVVVGTGPTSSFTMDAGIAAGNTTSSDTLIDGVTIAATTGGDDEVYSSGMDPGTNGRQWRVWPNGQYITLSAATGAATGWVAVAIVTVIEPAE